MTGVMLSSLSAPVLLGLSVVVLVLGPLSLARLERSRVALQLMDGFVLVSVAGLVLADVLPHALRQGGWVVVPLVLIGLIGPSMLEGRLGHAARRVHLATLIVGVSGLVLHAGIDGVALSSVGSEGVSSNIAVAVLLHRLPEGLTIWWLLRPSHGRWVAMGTLGLVAVSTAVGMTIGQTTEFFHQTSGLAYIGALVGGSLLHVVVHRSHPMVHAAPQGRWHLASGWGALAGAGLLTLLLSTEHGHGAEIGPEIEHLREVGGMAMFWNLARESAPALLLAYAAAGLVQVALPAASVAWMRRGGSFSQALRGMIFGLPLPICSCGVVPVYRSLVLQGVPASAALAFLVATPELGLDAVLLSIPLLGLDFTLVRLFAAAAVALGVGYAVGRMADFARTPEADVAAEGEVESLTRKDGLSLGARVMQGLRVGLGEIVDHTGPWVLLGLAVAALAAPLLQGGWLGQINPWWGVPLLALIGMPVYVCASGATPLVAVLVASGVSPGAGLAFLLTGPATNVSTFGVLSRLHSRKVALAFAFAVAGLAIGLGWAVDALMSPMRLPKLQTIVQDTHSWGADLAVAVLALLFVASLLRQGPRRFLGQVLAFANGDGLREDLHDHDHDHGDHGAGRGHDHGHGLAAAGATCSDGCGAGRPVVKVKIPGKTAAKDGCPDGCGH